MSLKVKWILGAVAATIIVVFFFISPEAAGKATILVLGGYFVWDVLRMIRNFLRS